MNEPKIYCNGVFVREKVLGTGHSLMNVAVKIEDFIAFAKQHGTDGFVKLVIEKRREPSDKGITHSVRLDTWKPSGQARQPAPQQGAPRLSNGGVDFKKMLQKKEQPKLNLDSDDSDSIPF